MPFDVSEVKARCKSFLLKVLTGLLCFFRGLVIVSPPLFYLLHYIKSMRDCLKHVTACLQHVYANYASISTKHCIIIEYPHKN
jgi:hypothetical protein